MVITSYDYVMSYYNDVCACDSENDYFVEVSAREDPVRSLPLAISAIYERHEVNSYMVLRAGLASTCRIYSREATN